MAEYGLADSCTANSGLAEYGLARYSPPGTRPTRRIHSSIGKASEFIIALMLELRRGGVASLIFHRLQMSMQHSLKGRQCRTRERDTRLFVRPALQPVAFPLRRCRPRPALSPRSRERRRAYQVICIISDDGRLDSGPAPPSVWKLNASSKVAYLRNRMASAKGRKASLH